MRNRLAITLCARPTGWLLRHANAKPPVTARTEFYALKVKLCKRFGFWERVELQHVVKECWGCENDRFVTGCRDCLRYGPRPGVYREFWVRLERWNLGGFIFHEPTIRYDRKPEWHGAEIEGLIEHDGSFALSRECWLWLALIFDRKEFRRCFTGSSTKRGWLPLLALQRLCWATAHWRESRWGQKLCKRFNWDDGIPF